MARFDERSGQLYVTELGRVASHYYIRHSSIVAFNDMLKPHMSEAEVLHMPQTLHGMCQRSPKLSVCAAKCALWSWYNCCTLMGSRVL